MIRRINPADEVNSGSSKVRKEEAKPVYIGHEIDYLYDGQMPVMEQEFKNGALQQTRVHFLGGRGIEAVVTIDHTSRDNPTTLRWLLYDGHGNLVRTMAPDYALSEWQFRGVWGEVQGNLALGRGYCANLGHPEDETGLVYMRARYYEPATGRFISEDPARDGVNWYLYAYSNPVSFADYDGKIPRKTKEWLVEFVKSYILFALATLGFQINDVFELDESSPLFSHALDAISGLLEAIGAMKSIIELGQRIERSKDPWKVWAFAGYALLMSAVHTMGMVTMSRYLVLIYLLYADQDLYEKMK